MFFFIFYDFFWLKFCFISENLIGKGGSNRVYKGILPDGKAVAVKILKSSKEACKDFANEIEIISSLKHKHIMPLIGVCTKDYDLVSVYDLSSKGSLEEILHGIASMRSVFHFFFLILICLVKVVTNPY